MQIENEPQKWMCHHHLFYFHCIIIYVNIERSLSDPLFMTALKALVPEAQVSGGLQFQKVQEIAKPWSLILPVNLITGKIKA